MSGSRGSTVERNGTRHAPERRARRPGVLLWASLATLATGLCVGASLSPQTRTAVLSLAGLDTAPRSVVLTQTLPDTDIPLTLPPSSTPELHAALQTMDRVAHKRAAPPEAGTGTEPDRAPLPENAAQAPSGEPETPSLPENTPENTAFQVDPVPPMAAPAEPASAPPSLLATPSGHPAGPPENEAGDQLEALFQDLASPGTKPEAPAGDSGSETTDARFAGAPDPWRGGTFDDSAPTAHPLAARHRDTPPNSRAARSPASPAPAPEALWKRNAVSPPSGSGPMVAVIIDDMGLDRPRTRRVAALDGPLTLSYLTYAGNLQAQMDAARENGHELLLHMPMEPLDPRADPGPGALRLADSPAHITRTLRDNLDRARGYVGINNHMGSRFTADAAAMKLVMEELARRGLMWVDSVTSARTKGAVTAAATGVPYASRTVFLDNDPDCASVLAQLAALERAARRHGQAIAIGHPREGTILALQAWLPTLGQKGLRLVPVSALARPPGNAPGTLVSQHRIESRQERTR